MTGWLTVQRGAAPLVVAFPHTGTEIPEALTGAYVSRERAINDADWWIDRLYAFAADMGATLVHTAISRSVIDMNRPPSGASLYPGQTTTELCPTTTFDGDPLYRDGQAPDAAEIDRRRLTYHAPYHAALTQELDRLRAAHGRVVLYDAHSIRSVVPRLFDGLLPQFNIGVNGGTTCAPGLRDAVEAVCRDSEWSTVVDGRFRGGWTVRHHGQPDRNIHAIQMELSCRGYMDEPLDEPLEGMPARWPAPWDPARAAPMQDRLRRVLDACLRFAEDR